MKVDYDKRADVLYITFRSHSGKCKYLENGRGQIIRVDALTAEIVGCTIPMFSRRVANGELDIPEIGDAGSTEAISELLHHI